ncbi:hypothetical protein RIF29_15010 [Crotalaria pallida]|uniref:Photosystem I assembly protein Ycf3 n=1 Tax=Crotalaria pallida TaxID=3830 RepID=A0AAN9FCD4_CROPI
MENRSPGSTSARTTLLFRRPPLDLVLPLPLTSTLLRASFFHHLEKHTRSDLNLSLWKRQPTYYNLGVAYSEKMQYDMALTFYERAATERPMYAEAYCSMGEIFKNRGDLGAAITCYERTLVVLSIVAL